MEAIRKTRFKSPLQAVHRTTQVVHAVGQLRHVVRHATHDFCEKHSKIPRESLFVPLI